MAVSHVHHPVMLQEVMEYWPSNPSGIYVDATLGRGGHSMALLARLNESARLWAFDRDPEAVAYGVSHVVDPRVQVMHASFMELSTCLDAQGIQQVDGFFFDLGVSSPQLDNPERGFSFMRDGPLDMRMDPTWGRPVSEYLAHASVSEMTQLFQEWGEERYAHRIARAIAQAREKKPITTTHALASIIASSVPGSREKQHPATRCFQALRMWVNDEVAQMRAGFETALARLGIGARLLVLTFHAIEVRVLKEVLGSFPSLKRHFDIKKMKVSNAEARSNPRARSAFLRVIEKIA